jgi:hypothetical protein
MKRTRKRHKTKQKRERKGTRKMLGGDLTRKRSHISFDTNRIFSDNNSFNENPFVRESHNCYMYFLNKKNKEVVELCKKDYPKYKLCRRAQPGYISGHNLLNKNDYKCPVIMKRTLADNRNIYRATDKEKCIPSHYKGALVVAPNRDYHYYRENDDGQWSHKPGYKPSSNFDSNNNRIINPRNASRDYGGTLNYKDFCGYLCVPRDEQTKRMAHWNHTGGKQKRGEKRSRKKRGEKRSRKKRREKRSRKKMREKRSRKKN